MKKKKQKLQTFYPSELLPADRSYRTFMDENEFNLRRAIDRFMPRVVNTLYHWAEQDDSLELTQFLLKYKIPRNTFAQWRRKYPELQDAVDEAKHIIAMRRRLGALNGKYDKDMILKDMHLYDTDWDEHVNRYWNNLHKERLQAKAEARAEDRNITIVMDSAPNTQKQENI